MKLVWHIAKKDLRRFGPLVVVWLALLAAAATGFRLFRPWDATATAGDIGGWLAVLQIWARMVIGLFAVTAYLAAGALVVEDPLENPNAFWPTRPIGNWRLLAGKSLALALLFVVAPALVLGGAWAGAGASWRDVLLAAGAMGRQFGLVVLFALMIATLVRSLAQFALATLALGAAYFVCGFGVEMLMAHPLPARRVLQARELIVTTLPLPVALFVVVQQFLRWRRAWVTIAVALAACAAFRLAWPWSWSDWTAPQPAGDDAATIKVVPGLEYNRFQLTVTTPWAVSGFYAPVSAAVIGSDANIKALPTTFDVAARRVLGIDRNKTDLEWTLIQVTGASPDATKDEGSQPTRNGLVDAWLMRPRIMGEAALVEGAETANGASRTRIVTLHRNGERLDGIVVEERDVAPEGGLVPARSAGGMWIDQYVLLDHGSGHAAALRWSPVGGGAGFLGFGTAVKTMTVRGNDSWRGAVLVKVRFERIRSLVVPFGMPGPKPEGATP